MGRGIRAIYGQSWAFALALPLVFLVPAIPEFIQHVVEYRLGMYQDWAAARAMAHARDRLAWGYAKTLMLLLPGYWLPRFMLLPGGARQAAAPAWPAVGLWLALFALQAAVQAWQLFGPPVGTLLGASGRSAAIAGAVPGIVMSIVGIYLTAWAVAWPLGTARIGPLASARLMAGSFWRTVGYLLAGVVPLMAAHYLLGLGAIGRPVWLVWPMLVADAVVVAMLGHTMTAASVVAARAAAARRGASLLPAGPATA